MNIKELHTPEKAVSVTSLFKSDLGNATAIQIMKGEKFKKHVTKIPALLICAIGQATFEDEKGAKKVLRPGDYMNINLWSNIGWLGSRIAN
jgi:quercetin dioxygenase-like cupin family protein